VVVTDLGFASGPAPSRADGGTAGHRRERRIGNLDRSEVLNVIGDVRGKRAIIVDDEIDTAGTLIQIVNASSARA